jgi:hypothetical protein
MAYRTHLCPYKIRILPYIQNIFSRFFQRIKATVNNTKFLTFTSPEIPNLHQPSNLKMAAAYNIPFDYWLNAQILPQIKK